MSQTLKSTYAVIIAAVFLLTVFLPLSNLRAQPAGEQSVSGNGFRISPVTDEYVIEPGQTEIMNITIENPTNAPLTAVAIVNDFVAGENEDGEVRPILDENAPAPRNSFRSLIGPIDNIDLGPNERFELEVPITVPVDANAGGYYGIIRFEPADRRDDGNVTLSASVGTVTLVRVPGDLTERLDLVEISAAQDNSLRSFFTGGDVSVLVRLRNSGDIHLQPHGLVQVKNMFGDVVASYELNDTTPRAYILPDTIRRFQDDLEDRNWFGRYTIETNIGNIQSGGEPLNARATFWYIPAWALIALFVALGAIAFGVVSLINRRSNNKKRRK